jgi:transposase
VTHSGRQNADAALIAALAGGASRQKAAQMADVSESTVYRRLADAEFVSQVESARADMVDQATGRLTYLTLAAIEMAAKLMLTAESETVRLGAVRTILEYGTKFHDNEEFESRLESLEQERLPTSARSRWTA